MIPNTPLHYIFIRGSIWALRVIAPLSTVYCFSRLLGYTPLPTIPWSLEVFAYAEVAFCFFVSLPRQWILNHAQPRAVSRSREERRELFERCWTSIPDLEAFLSIWFKGVNIDTIHRQDLKDFLASAFLYKTTASPADDDELESYVVRIENSIDREFPPGRGLHRPSKSTSDVLHLQHKPLVFYAVGIVFDDLSTYVTANWMGLRHFRIPLRQFFTVFPLRPQTLISQQVSPSKELSYWYRPHTSKKRKPVLFLHGIGAGLRTYTGFLKDFIERDALEDDDGQVGIIALEIMPISMRITKAIPPRTEMLSEIFKILDYHGWDKFVIVGHSFGTIIATHLLQKLGDTGRVGPLLLVDPVTLSIHWGDIPYNFLYRHPRKASEWQLHYFISTDMGAAHSITRNFDWTQNVLWREDMRGRVITVALADADIVMDTFAIRKYLVDDDNLNAQVYNAKDLTQEDGFRRYHQRLEQRGLDIIWYEGLNHADIWDRARTWAPLVEILNGYCGMSW
ncbi:alpha beta hydrolase fold family [Microthyrium microscopicum]|uniref:Alpha beta hydrolase fold family n=1 Tax=Microthyrium microscopicum TaxID=703497 RepID=A0A6A6U3R0_9PEZI|nr:alpha beta hydrolase fold family [Microthyrium microscopicum]